MSNLGGHDLAAIIDAFDGVDHDRPVCFIAYTIKGYRPAACRPQGQSRRPDDAGADGDVPRAR